MEHAEVSLPAKPGEVEKIEQEYIRRGTTTLIATRDVVTGKIFEPFLNHTRTEKDYANHIENVINTDPNSSWILINDQLNTHKSESLVRVFAKLLNIPENTLGEKGKHGILKNMETRANFLSDTSHRIRIQYTPKHCSWLNQIEIWFGILCKKSINRRSSFSSVEDLETKIRQFIEYYNQHLAKPFKWTYAGKLLQA